LILGSTPTTLLLVSLLLVGSSGTLEKSLSDIDPLVLEDGCSGASDNGGVYPSGIFSIPLIDFFVSSIPERGPRCNSASLNITFLL
jgi:hypothetical protein